MGKTIAPWDGQQLSEHVVEVLDQVRASIWEGNFNWKDWDHNSKNYRQGRSNKKVRIAGATLLGRPCTQEEAEKACLAAILGSKR